mmetsp:Transcript_87391/g.187426  ORF Transcript_87391/g.187426 Transcript_87391/m.187426 type:complete len:99 (-) Transcript_87391:95-391(-)
MWQPALVEVPGCPSQLRSEAFNSSSYSCCWGTRALQPGRAAFEPCPRFERERGELAGEVEPVAGGSRRLCAHGLVCLGVSVGLWLAQVGRLSSTRSRI